MREHMFRGSSLRCTEWTGQAHPRGSERIQAGSRYFNSNQFGHREVRAMIGRLSLLAIGVVIGMALASALPELQQLLRAAVAASSGPALQAKESGGQHNPGAGASDDQQRVVKLSADDIEAAGIENGIGPERHQSPSYHRPEHDRFPPADRIAHVAVRVSGTVTELRKTIGDPVATEDDP
jgi:hypothetical protein